MGDTSAGGGREEAGGEGREGGFPRDSEGDLTGGLLICLLWSISLVLPLVGIPRPRLDCFCRTRCKGTHHYGINIL